MINKNLIKKIADHILHPEKKQFIDNHIMHPEREWSIGLLIGIGIFVAGVVWGIYAFDFYKNIEVENVETEASTVVYRASVIDEALREFVERERIYNDLLAKSRPVFSLEENSVQATTSTSTVETGRSPEMIPAEPQTDPETVSDSNLATSSTSVGGSGEIILLD